jgi:hypothetical protein
VTASCGDVIELTNTTNALPYGLLKLVNGERIDSIPTTDAGLAILERVQNALGLGRWTRRAHRKTCLENILSQAIKGYRK